MKNEPLVSIILPVYNTGNILRKTFESIVNQSYRNIELIMVDDGSSEETASLVDELARSDCRVKILHQNNSGTCVARNFGLNIANGDFITFCDHDDLYTPDLIKKEVLSIQQANYDIVIVGKEYIYENGTRKRYSMPIECTEPDESKLFFLKLISNQTASTVWNILYKKTLIDNYKFDETIKKGQEDLCFNLNIVENVNSIKSIDECLYLHYLRSNISTSASFHWETLYAMQGTVKKMSDVIKTISFENDAYTIQFLGEVLRTYVMYAIKLNVDIKKFKELVNELDFLKVSINKSQISNKESLVYYLVSKRKTRLLFCITKAFNTIRRVSGR